MKTAHLQNESDWLAFCRDELAHMAPAYTPLGKAQRDHGIDSYEALSTSQWSPEFERLMRNRLIMGAIRYGRFHKPGKAKYDRVASIIRRIQAYSQTGNQEYLVDAANEALCEFIEPSHPHPIWDPQDDGQHTEEL